LPGLERHLRALEQQDIQASQVAIREVRESFRQKWIE
jgi:hypothetical protein